MSLRVAGVFDLEAAHWDRFLVGEALAADGSSVVWWDADMFADWMLSRTGIWYAHAGGRYDMLWLLDIAVRRGLRWDARMRGSGVLSVRIGSLEVRDSFALVPMSLEKAAPIGTYRKTAVGLPCVCGKPRCKAYCALDRIYDKGGPDAHEKRKVEEYLHADCLSLYSMLDTLETLATDHGIQLGLSIGGTAWKTAKEWLGLPKCEHEIGRYRRLREGYYGGRTEVFRTRAPEGHRYDIHSSYPAALVRHALPEGHGIPADASRASRHFAAGKPCIIGATVNVPHSNVPPLPMRHPDRLLYPYGSVTGAWTSLELAYAMECGVTVERVGWGHVWETESPFLAPYASRVWKMRADSVATCRCAALPKKDRGCRGCAFGAWVKWLANSLTGKLAERPEHDSLRFLPFPEGWDGMDVLRTIDTGSFVRVETLRVSANAHVQCAAFLTAGARTELHRQLVHAPTPLYCDTDSVYAAEQLTRRIGDELGEWGYEGALTRWHALAPKVYRYFDPAKNEWAVRGKGMPGLDSDGFTRLHDHEVADGWTEHGLPWDSDTGVEGMRTALRRMGKGEGGSLFVRKYLSRALHAVAGWVGGRELAADGVTTLPVTVERYESREVPR